MVVVVDYDMGNLGSIGNMIKKVGHKFLITSSCKDVENASKIILPGVGSFDHAVKSLKSRGLFEVIQAKALGGNTPVLGICLGMQLLTNGSEEGDLEGLGLVDAHASKFRFDGVQKKLPVPHMGWNVATAMKDSYIMQNMPREEMRFYFVHSYAVSCADKSDELTTTQYGRTFVSSFQKNNVIGCQFHPEKSHKFGMSLFSNFMDMP